MKKAVRALLALCALAPCGAASAQEPAAQAARETVTVTAAPIPDAAITNFVKTYTAPSAAIGKIPKWAQGICLKTEGLAKTLDDAVTKRILQVAADVGAPVQKQPCGLNVAIIFDPNPQAVMDDIAANHEELLGYHEKGQLKALSTVRYPIQAWYATGTRDDKGIWQADTPQTTPYCDAIDTNTMTSNLNLTGGLHTDAARYQQVLGDWQRYCGREYTSGRRLKNGLSSEFASVTVVAATDTVNYHELGALADYLALLTLSQTQTFDTCQKMESVANLLVPGCDPANRIKGLTAGDIAYLKALYRADTSGTLVAQQAAITGEMKKVLAQR